MSPRFNSLLLECFRKGGTELIIPHLVEGSMPVLQEKQFFFLETCFCVYGCPFNKVIDSV